MAYQYLKAFGIAEITEEAWIFDFLDKNGEIVAHCEIEDGFDMLIIS